MLYLIVRVKYSVSVRILHVVCGIGSGQPMANLIRFSDPCPISKSQFQVGSFFFPFSLTQNIRLPAVIDGLRLPFVRHPAESTWQRNYRLRT